MKKVLCLLMALALCLGLTGCAAKPSADMNGEWYVLQIAWSEEMTEEAPGSVYDMPGSILSLIGSSTFGFRPLSDELTLVRVTKTVGNGKPRALARKGDSGIWTCYVSYFDGSYYVFEDGKGSLYEQGGDEAIPLTYAASGDKLTLKFESGTAEDRLERWDDDLYFWGTTDQGYADGYIFVRRHSLVGDQL